MAPSPRAWFNAGRAAGVAAFDADKNGLAQLTLANALVFKNQQVFSSCRVEGEVGDGVAGGREDRIVEFHLKVLRISAKNNLVARALRGLGRAHSAYSLRWNAHIDNPSAPIMG